MGATTSNKPMTARKVCIVLTTRGNFAKMRSTIVALGRDDRVDVRIVVGGAALSRDYGDVAAAIERSDLRIERRVDYVVDGDALIAIARSAGIATDLFARVLDELSPDVVVLVGDRFEALSVALAATCLGIPIAHVEGGEVSGSIDESIRHAITKLSHIHFTATPDAAERVRRLGEEPDAVHVVGTPTIDVIAAADLDDRSLLENALSPAAAAIALDPSPGYVVVLQHPVATEHSVAYPHAAESVKALTVLGLPAIWVVPNHEAGAGEVLRALREVGSDAGPAVVLSKSLPIEAYAALLKRSRCLIGNSSSGIRECEFIGVPVVNVGTRQSGRERGENVIDVVPDHMEIVAAARRQLEHGPYTSRHLYGDGRAGERIARVLASAPLTVQKRITY